MNNIYESFMDIHVAPQARIFMSHSCLIHGYYMLRRRQYNNMEICLKRSVIFLKDIDKTAIFGLHISKILHE